MPASDDEDAVLALLEEETSNDPAVSHLREARLQQLATELKISKQLRNEGYGTYARLTDEKALMELTTSTEYCVVHFYKPDFNRCRIMDGHIEALAPIHLSTRFLKIDVEHAPFLVTKLNIKVLPCVIAFVEGVSADRIVGFEGLGFSGDSFKTAELEKRLVGCGVLEKVQGIESGAINCVPVMKGQAEPKSNKVDDDDDDEWD